MPHVAAMGYWYVQTMSLEDCDNCPRGTRWDLYCWKMTWVVRSSFRWPGGNTQRSHGKTLKT